MKVFRRNHKDQTAVPTDEELLVVERVLARGGDIFFGAPTRCPSCGSFGNVEEVDTSQMTSRCPSCSATWTITRRALAAVRRTGVPVATGDAAGARRPVGVEGDGVLVRNLYAA